MYCHEKKLIIEMMKLREQLQKILVDIFFLMNNENIKNVFLGRDRY